MLAIVALVVAMAPSAEPASAQSQPPFDIVLRGGRVMDPETRLDAVRNVGIRGDQIAEITARELQGKVVVDASGLVVAPGFIDLHAHGQTNAANEFQAHDGVTTALELEDGVPFMKPWLDARTGKALINFGAAISHDFVRWLAMEAHRERSSEARAMVAREGVPEERRWEILRLSHEARYQSLQKAEHEALLEGLSSALTEGSLGIGVSLGYFPGASREEVFRVHEFAATMKAPIFTHVRTPSIAAIQEAIANGATTGAPVHIVHLNSMALGEIGVALDMVRSAREQGLDISTELYPYTAGSTGIGSTLFDEGWQEVWNMTYSDLQWVETGERLTRETFEKYREQGGLVILHMMKEEWIEQGIRAPFTSIGSDGMPYSPGAHPRSAGCFARVLGRYVREREVITLMEALRKMTLMPAERLAGIAPAMRLKGRVQVGSDADLTLFDPERVRDTASFEADLSFSEGIEHVLVNGTFLVRDGKTVKDVYPGRPVLGKYRR